MARKKYEWTEDRIAKFMKEGRGSGVGKDYKPWLMVSDVPSLGRSHRIAWNTTGRTHHLLSDNEYYAFLRLCFDDDVVDIREQFPLRREETLEIASALQVRHPAVRGVDIVMTTDFLVTRRTHDGYQIAAQTVKETGDLDNLRTIEKLEIERIYWACRKTSFSIISSSELKNTYSRNLAWIFEHASVDEQRVDRLTGAIKARLLEIFSRAPSAPLRTACGLVDQELGTAPGQSLQTARNMLGSKELLVDLNLNSLPDLPCSSFAFTGVAQ
jgi:TnsA endonuclease N terminal/TnsA endonuclease C terminal